MTERNRIGSFRSSSGPCGALRVEEQRIARLHRVGAVAVAVHYLAFQHVQELESGMLEDREHVGLLGRVIR